MAQQYDLIFAGGGLSGLTLALECAGRPFFQGKKILVIDRDEKNRNDRTWCFWATGDEPLPPVVFKSWDRCLFYGDQIERVLDIAPYRYHMVRGLDFYAWAKSEMAKHPDIHRITANILEIEAVSGTVKTDLGDFQGQRVFNSAFTKIPVLPAANADYPNPPFSISGNSAGSQHDFTRLLQHFKGWLIETPSPAFDPAIMTFMDYRLEQEGETRFVYVLPLTETRALVEFTVFSPSLCPAGVYDAALNRYIREFLKIETFRIEDSEFGVIPMTDYPFSPVPEGKVIHIGTAGGFVKASSGYAFKRTQRKLRAFADAWEQSGAPDPAVLRAPWRFRFYDSVMLRVLRDQSVGGKAFFSGLFRQLPPQLVFRFLDEESTFADDLRLLQAPPTWPFLKTALKQLPVLPYI